MGRAVFCMSFDGDFSFSNDIAGGGRLGSRRAALLFMMFSAPRSSLNMGRAVLCMSFDGDFSFSSDTARGGPDMLGIRDMVRSTLCWGAS